MVDPETVIDWNNVETKLFELCVHAIKNVKFKDPNEKIHAFVLDMTAERGEIFLSADTFAGLEKRAQSAVKDSVTNALALKQYRWSSGDYDHMLFSETDPFWTAQWDQGLSIEIEAKFQAAFDWLWTRKKNGELTEAKFDLIWEDQIKERFRRFVCRVTFKLFHSNVFSTWPLTDDFAILALDHHDPDTHALERQAKVWKSCSELKI